MRIASLRGLLSSVREGKIDPKAYSEGLIEKIKAHASGLDLFSALTERVAVEGDGSLLGLPYSVKDNICVKGSLTRAGSNILEGYRPPFDATVVSRMKKAGGAFIGTTNMDEFGFGTFSTNCAFGRPRNPFDPSRSCGGSSGGAAGATAILAHHVAISESTGGSISCPASFCGVVGMTPTYGRVSRYGLIDYANSLDKIGLMGRSVEDVALVLNVIAGKDPKDMTSLSQPDLDIRDREIKSIAIPEELVSSIPDERIVSLFDESVKKLEGLGIEAVRVSMPVLRFSIPSYYILACAEASTNLAKYCGMRYGLPGKEFGRTYNEFFTDVRTQGFGAEAKRRLMLGTFARMAGYRDQYYMKALKVRASITQKFKEIFREYDLIATPTMPLLPPQFERIMEMSPATIYALDFLTVPPNLAGIPQLSMPMGYVEKLPAGIHFLADHWEESKLISMGKIWEGQVERRYPMSLEGTP